MHDAIDKIGKIVDGLSLRSAGRPFFADPRYKAYDFDKNYFHSIGAGTRKICFIDGGNASIISAPHFELSMLRVYYGAYSENKKAECARNDYYLAVHASTDGGRLLYNAELIPVSSESSDAFLFDANDETLKQGKFSAEISHVGGIVRRFLEWKMGAALAERIDGSIIVMDGSLQTGYTGENIFANDAYSAAMKNDVIFSGLSKTSSLMTTTGLNLMYALNKMGPPGSWAYNPIADISHADHNAEMFAVKLHKHALTCYRYEVLKSQKSKAEEAIASLANNAGDFRYPGYPYGMIDADVFARISEREQQMQKALFAGTARQLKDAAAAGDAHEIINRIVS